MGNSESANPIRNLDKRTARREYREDFLTAINRFRKQYVLLKQSTSHKNEDNNILKTWDDNNIRVFARKRPIFTHEIENNEYDVVTCINSNIVIHDCRMHTDMKRQFINHHEFQFDGVFSEKASNQSVYEATTKPLVEIACEGGFSTALVYGQTGSGKVISVFFCFFLSFACFLLSVLLSLSPIAWFPFSCHLDIHNVLYVFSSSRGTLYISSSTCGTI
jgi:kinesin family protein 2/24